MSPRFVLLPLSHSPTLPGWNAWTVVRWFGAIWNVFFFFFLKRAPTLKKDEKGHWNVDVWINLDVCWTCGTFTESIGSRCQDLVPLFGFYSCCSGSWQSKCCFCTTTHLIQQKSAWLTFWFPFWISKAGFLAKNRLRKCTKHIQKKHEYRHTLPETNGTFALEILADSKRKEKYSNHHPTIHF